MSAQHINSINLLNIYLANAEKWDGNSTPSIALCPITIDDIKVKEIIAYDCNLKPNLIDALNKPLIPQFVVGLNERVDPKTMKVKNSFISGNLLKSLAEKQVPSHHRISWYYIPDNQEPWFKGDAEIEFGFLTDYGARRYGRFTNIKDANWQRLGVPIAPYGYLANRFSVVMYEDDMDGGGETRELRCGGYITQFSFAYVPVVDDDDEICVVNEIPYGGERTWCEYSPPPPGSYHDFNTSIPGVRVSFRMSYCNW